MRLQQQQRFAPAIELPNQVGDRMKLSPPECSTSLRRVLPARSHIRQPTRLQPVANSTRFVQHFAWRFAKSLWCECFALKPEKTTHDQSPARLTMTLRYPTMARESSRCQLMIQQNAIDLLKYPRLAIIRLSPSQVLHDR